MFRFLHLADLHLGACPAYLGNSSALRSQDYLNAFSKAVDFALEPTNNIDAVVIAGDLFDIPNPQDAIVNSAIAQLRRLKIGNIPVIITPGNHDAIGMPNCVYKQRQTEFTNLAILIDSCQVTHAYTLRINGDSVFFYGMAWDPVRSRIPFDNFFKLDEPGYHIAVLHGTLQSSRFAEGYSREVPLELSNLSKTGMDYIALGHIHAFQRHMAGPVPVVYPGSLEGRRFVPGEEGDRSLVVVTLNHEQPAEIRTIKWNRRVLKSACINLERETVETIDEIAELIRNRFGSTDTLLNLELNGTPPFIIDSEELKARLIHDFFWLSIDDQTDPVPAMAVEGWSQEDTIRGLYVRKLIQQIKSASTEEERQKIELALKLGIQALQKSIQR